MISEKHLVSGWEMTIQYQIGGENVGLFLFLYTVCIDNDNVYEMGDLPLI